LALGERVHEDLFKDYSFFECPRNKVAKRLGADKLLAALEKMLMIRNLETRAEAAYLQGKVGGFFHSYIGQEAIQTAIVEVFGTAPWYAASYRCHALALLLGATPNEIMAEFYGKKTGNAGGKGGSMHLYTDKLLGGFGIVGGQVPIAIGAAFANKYRDIPEPAICFLGDGAVAQGAFHESLNLASLWDLPCIIVIENNVWGMGTRVNRAISEYPIAEKQAKSYGIESYTIDGTQFLDCYEAFSEMKEKVAENGKPILVEVVVERFKGHSVSDPALYREKEDLQKITKCSDPILLLKKHIEQLGALDEEAFKALDKSCKDIALEAMKYADSSPWPDPISLEEGVYAE